MERYRFCENLVAAAYLKPLLKKITSQMHKLQKLEVKRYNVPTWEDLCRKGPRLKWKQDENKPVPFPFITWDASTDCLGRPTQPWVDMKMAAEIQRSIDYAVLKRSQKMEEEKKTEGGTMKSVVGQTSELPFTSQLDLPDNPAVTTSQGHDVVEYPADQVTSSPNTSSNTINNDVHLEKIRSDNWRVVSHPVERPTFLYRNLSQLRDAL